MAISELKITAEDTINKKISDIEGDTLVGTPADNKAKFDDYPELIKGRFNDLVDALADYLTSSGVGQGSLSDTIKVVLESGAEYYVPKLNANNKINSAYIDDASTSQKGLLSATDKTKLNQLKVAVDYIENGITNPPTSNAVYDAIEEATSIRLNIEDYIIFDGFMNDAGNFVDWHVRKWANGLIEAWTKYPQSGDVGTWESWQGMYQFDLGYLNFPTNLFNSAPVIELANITSANYTCWLGHRYGYAGHTKNRTCTYSIMRPARPDNTFTCEVAYYVAGY